MALGGVGILLPLPLAGVKDLPIIPIVLYAEVGVCEPEDDGDVLLPLTDGEVLLALTDGAFRNRNGELVRGFEALDAMSSSRTFDE